MLHAILKRHPATFCNRPYIACVRSNHFRQPFISLNMCCLKLWILFRCHQTLLYFIVPNTNGGRYTVPEVSAQSRTTFTCLDFSFRMTMDFVNYATKPIALYFSFPFIWLLSSCDFGTALFLCRLHPSLQRPMCVTAVSMTWTILHQILCN